MSVGASEAKADAPQGGPPLASLVRAGDAQTAANEIAPAVYMVKDISNLYLVADPAGDVLVNTGFMDNAERNRALLAPVRQGPLKAIVLTQSHADHFGCVPELKEAGTAVYAQARFPANAHDMIDLQPHFGPRSGKLWGSTMKRGGAPKPPPVVVPDVLVDREFGFEVAGRRFELISTPDGETTDALTVWLPAERIAFTGNLVGPVWLSMPFLCTIRGDKPRSVRSYLSSLERLKALGAEMIVTGHGDPIRGAEKIRADIERMHAAVSYVRDQTLAGMKAGKTVHELMREIRLPEDIRIGEFHGKVSWAVRTIWEEYSGWFHYDATTSLYGVPRSSVDTDLVKLAGGAQALANRAQGRLDRGETLEAMHLVEIALGAEPDSVPALQVKKAALERLLADSGGSNLSETMWLRSEIAAADRALAPTPEAAASW